MQVIWSLGLGGAEQMVIALASGLDPGRWRVSVCCLHGEGAFAAPLTARGVPVFAMRKRPKCDPTLMPRLVRLMRRERVAVVQTHLWSANFWGRLAAARAGVPVVVATEHGIERWRGPLHRWADRRLLRRTDRVVYVSEATRRRQVAQGRVPPWLTEWVSNGVALNGRSAPEPKERARCRQRLGVGADDRIALFVGRLVPEKGLAFLIAAAARLRGRLPHLRVVLVGTGPLEVALRTRARQAGVTDIVRFAGLQQDVAPWYGAADCLVLPSLSEALPMTVLEAMAAGLPVVATAVGDVPELLGLHQGVHSPPSPPHIVADPPRLVADTVHGSTLGGLTVDRGPSTVDAVSLYEVAEAGLLGPPGDAVALAAALERLLTDNALAERLGAAGRARVAGHYTSQRMVERYAQLYETLLAQKGWTS